jgi:uncharacterized protein YbaP (TraB family)
MKHLQSKWAWLIALILWAPFAKALQTDTGSLLWKISGNGLKKPSYLYGTIHIQDKRAFDFTPEMLKAFKKSKGFAMELLPDAGSAIALMSKMALPKSTSLKDLYTAEEYALLEGEFLERTKAPLSLFTGYKPFIAYSMLAQSNFQSDMKEALDLHLLKKAKEQKKKLTGLETMDEQIGAILAIPDSTQARMLYEVATDSSGDNSEAEKMIRLYQEADLHGMEVMMQQEEIGIEFEQGLVITRNHNMADRMVPLMLDESTFTAVGSLHLPGEQGILNLLRKKGYTVEPVISTQK